MAGLRSQGALGLWLHLTEAAPLRRRELQGAAPGSGVMWRPRNVAIWWLKTPKHP